MQIPSKTFFLQNGQLSTQFFGNKEGVPVLAIHGWLDNSSSFAALEDIFNTLKLNVCALDLPGHGLSSHRKGKLPLTLLDTLLDLIELLDALGWDKCTLIGHSMGAGIAFCLAACFPERVKGLICLDGLIPATRAEKDTAKCLRQAILMHARNTTKTSPKYRNLEEAIQRRAKAGPVSTEAITPVVKRGIQFIDGFWSWRTDPRLMSLPLIQYTPKQIESFVEALDVPTMMIRAIDGYDLDPHTFHWIEQLRKRIFFAYHEIPGRHHVHLECPDLLHSPLETFFQKLD